jgi:hypothetical protein
MKGITMGGSPEWKTEGAAGMPRSTGGGLASRQWLGHLRRAAARLEGQQGVRGWRLGAARRPASPFMGPRAGRQARGGGGVTAPHSGQAWQPGPDGPSAGLRRLSGLGRASGSAQSGRVDILFFRNIFQCKNKSRKC